MTATIPDKPEIGGDLVRVHRAITTALGMAMRHGETYLATDFPDAKTWKGYLTYARCLLTLLHGHHVTEDGYMFPHLRAKLPNAPYETLSGQHRAMIPMLEGATAALRSLKATPSPDELRTLREGLGQIGELWAEHIELEEGSFGPEALSSVLTMRERERAGMATMLRGAPHQWPPTLILPFLLHNMPPADRAIMSQAIPGFFPVLLFVAKPLWKVMTPFLMD